MCGERQSIGIELWERLADGEILGICSEYDILWDPFILAVAGKPGKPRPRDLNLFPDGTIRPASLQAIEAAGLAEYVDGTIEEETS